MKEHIKKDLKVKFIDPDTKFSLFETREGLIGKNGKLIKNINRIIDLRPLVIDRVEKVNEDKIHNKDKILIPSEVFYELVYKKSGYIKNFLAFYLPKIEQFLKPDNIFLEVGGGLSYISAIVKDKFPEVVVCASDISPQYLCKKSRPLAEALFDVIPDYYIACDAENLPFKNKSVDIIWTHNSLHHFSNPSKFLNEASRILREDGILVAMDTAEPYLNRKTYKRKKQKRSYELGIFEHSYTFFDWRKISKSSPFQVKYTLGRNIKSNAIRFVLNSILPLGIMFSNKRWK